MNRKLNIFLLAALGTIVCLVFLLIASVMSVGAAGGTNEYAHAIFLNVSNGIGGSDCFANDRPGDYFPQPDPYCQVLVNRGNPGEVRTARDEVIATDVATDIPVVITTPAPTQEVIVTDIATDIPVVTTEPTDEPVIVVTDVPQETPEPEATKECKNKNQYKEGTDDCNAGKGNG